MDLNTKYSRTEIIRELIEECCVLKYGKYVLKSGEKSEYYIDLKSLVSYPSVVYRIMSNISIRLIEDIEKKDGKKIDKSGYILCGVPTGGVFFASVLSIISGIPMIMIRDKKKIYGTKKQIEGNYQNKKLILVEDVITTGTSILEYLDIINNHEIEICNIVGILDRQKGGLQNIESSFLEKRLTHPNCFTYLNVSELLEEKEKLQSQHNQEKPIKDNINSKISLRNNEINCELVSSVNQWTEKLKKTIERKTNICLALDIPEWNRFFDILERISSRICMVKIHLDIMENTLPKNIKRLRNLAESKDFMIWEDRKFCDIGNTNRLQLERLLEMKLIDFVSVNPSGGSKSIEPFFDRIGIFVLAEMSSENNLINMEYTSRCLELVNKNNTKISGIINQTIKKKKINRNVLSLTPGISIYSKNDGIGQKYRTTQQLENTPDILVVGRAIYNNSIPEKVVDKLCDIN